MYGQFHAPKVASTSPHHQINREDLERAKFALAKLPNTVMSNQEAVEALVPHMVDALVRGSSIIQIQTSLSQIGFVIPDRTWQDLSPRLTKEAANRRQS